MKKIVVDRDLCEANARCVNIAPEVFRLDDDDELHVLVQHVDDDQLERVEEAVARCPRTALSLVDE